VPPKPVETAPPRNPVAGAEAAGTGAPCCGRPERKPPVGATVVGRTPNPPPLKAGDGEPNGAAAGAPGPKPGLATAAKPPVCPPGAVPVPILPKADLGAAPVAAAALAAAPKAELAPNALAVVAAVVPNAGGKTPVAGAGNVDGAAEAGEPEVPAVAAKGPPGGRAAPAAAAAEGKPGAAVAAVVAVRFCVPKAVVAVVAVPKAGVLNGAPVDEAEAAPNTGRLAVVVCSGAG
jgi:hypothetical protein